MAHGAWACRSGVLRGAREVQDTFFLKQLLGAGWPVSELGPSRVLERRLAGFSDGWRPFACVLGRRPTNADHELIRTMGTQPFN